MLVCAPAVYGQKATGQPASDTPYATSATPTTSVPAGAEKEIKGTIVDFDSQGFLLRDNDGAVWTVVVTGDTSIKTRNWWFDSGDKYTDAVLVRGFYLEVEGHGNAAGQLEAKKIRFDKDELRTARSVETRVAPVEHRMTAAENGIRSLDGQVAELNEVSKIMRSDIDKNSENIAAVDHRVTATNERITALGDFEVAQQATVLFKVNSAELTPEAKLALDQLAQQALTMKGYVIEVAGYTDSTGSEQKNRMLSHKRADAVVQYLGENHAIPLLRMVTPFGYGELKPAADNATREGREQNRRVEVTILVNKGLTQTAP
jgi:outer membrane protein OmpA-like peptidoglycan-associated protein